MLEMGDFLQQSVACNHSAAAPESTAVPQLRLVLQLWDSSGEITQELLFRNDNTAVVYLKAEPALYRSQICLAWHHELVLEPSSWSRLCVYLKEQNQRDS